MRLLRWCAFVLFILGIPMTYGATAPFSDVPEGSPYHTALSYLKDNDVLDGYADGSFRPDQIVNRAEALKMITLASGMNIAAGGELNFSDVPADSWFADYVATAVREGIVQGYADQTFKPANTINRVEAMKIAYGALGVHVNEIEVTEAPFADVPLTADTAWFVKMVAYAKQSNVLEPVTFRNFAPSDGMTRGDIAELLYRILYLRENKLDRYTIGYGGQISYYADSFEGNGTAYGETFRQNYFSAANLEYPHGTFIQIIDYKSNKSVVAKINDKGPYGHGRIVDLSKASFSALGPLSRGVSEGEVRKLFADQTLDKFTLSKTQFASITLDKNFPNIFQEGETYVFSGAVKGNASHVTMFYQSPDGKQEHVTVSVSAGRFSLPMRFALAGSYNITLIPGMEGSGAVATVRVITPVLGLTEIDETSAPTELRVEMNSDGTPVFRWNDTANTLARVVFYQGTHRVERLVNQGTFYQGTPMDFDGFQEGPVYWYVEGAKSSTVFSHDRYTEWKKSETKEFQAVMRSSMVIDPAVVLSSSHADFELGSITLQGSAKEAIQDTAFVVLPSGQVETFPITGNKPAANGLLPKDTIFTLSVPAKVRGSYVIEINKASGEAALIRPIYPTGSYPILPGRADVQPAIEVTAKDMMIQWINEDRGRYGLNPLRKDDRLSSLAQDRAEDMTKRNYFSHVNPDGYDVDDLRFVYQIKSFVGENIALDQTLYGGYVGLYESPAHRMNILDKEYELVGIGSDSYANGDLALVQVFAPQDVDTGSGSTLVSDLTARLSTATGNQFRRNPELEGVATAWSHMMVEENFFDISNGSKEIARLLGAFEFEKSVKTYIFTATSVAILEEKILETTSIGQGKYTDLGLGLEQGKDGLIKAVVLYY